MSDANLNTIPTAPVLDVDPKVLRENFGIMPFELKHSMANHELFTLPRLSKVVERCLAMGSKNKTKLVCADGLTEPKASFAELMQRPVAVNMFEDLKSSHSWIKLTNLAASDAEYAEVQQSIFQQVQEITGVPILRDLTWANLTVFIASPNIVTPYHIDHDYNFLMQIAGEKDIALFDPNDREVLRDEDIEKFYFGSPGRLPFPEKLESHGTVYRLKPGVAVHHPPLAAHWVKNGPEISISVSLGFCMHDIDRRARIYQMNYTLRKLGVLPAPPGRSSFKDGLKEKLVGLFRARTPKSYTDTIYSGLNRWKAPFKFAKSAVNWVRRK